MGNDEQNAGELVIKDRKTGLVVFGIFEIILGVFCTLMVPLMLFGMMASANLDKNSASSVSVSSMIPALFFYFVLAVWFLWMGIGSIRAKRWARALLLVTSWFWLICGTMGIVFMVFYMPDMFDQMARNGKMPPQVATITRYVTMGFLGVIYILLPGAFVLFYGSPHTKATCEQRDPQVRWTDKCPLPVLGLSLMSGLWAACMLLMGCYGWTIPFFGFILSGTSGAVVVLVSVLLLGFVTRGLYRLSINAWWCAVCLILTWGVSTGITFSRVSLMEFYEKMHFPAQQLEMMKQLGLPQASWMVLFCGLWVVIVLAYLLYIKRYFTVPVKTQVS